MISIKEAAAMSDREYVKYLAATPANEVETHVLRIGRLVRADYNSRDRFRFTKNRLRFTAASLQTAIEQQWGYLFFVKQFLAALAELAQNLLALAVEKVALLLPKSLSGFDEDEALLWKPDLIDATPRVVPRGPNSAFPVNTHRGGHYRSALGSVVLAA
ncbi:hypothetical protein [Streptomyces griseus]|uniref:hypothetical protein n=1 Tax=Streptomyces griseus TaxID=1911 RepID=UPI0033EFF95A